MIEIRKQKKDVRSDTSHCQGGIEFTCGEHAGQVVLGIPNNNTTHGPAMDFPQDEERTGGHSSVSLSHILGGGGPPWLRHWPHLRIDTCMFDCYLFVIQHDWVGSAFNWHTRQQPKTRNAASCGALLSDTKSPNTNCLVS